jgi:hypothetical protein
VSGSTISLAGQSVGGAFYPLKIYNNGNQGMTLISSSGSLNSVLIADNNTNPPPVSPLPTGHPATPCGICVRNSSSLNNISNSFVLDNVGDGIYLDMSSTAFASSGMTVTGNSGDGVHLETGAGIRFFTPTGGTPPPPNNISGNGGYGLNCTDGLSWAAGDTTGISKPIKCSVYK